MLISLSVSLDLFLRYVAVMRNDLQHTLKLAAFLVLVADCFSIRPCRFVMEYLGSPVDPRL